MVAWTTCHVTPAAGLETCVTDETKHPARRNPAETAGIYLAGVGYGPAASESRAGRTSGGRGEVFGIVCFLWFRLCRFKDFLHIDE